MGADLKAIGIPDATKIIKAWDTSVSLGGPIVRVKLWFYATTRLFGNYTDVAGRFGNLNAGDPTKWLYVVDPSIRQRSATSRKIVGGRITNQITQRNKVSAFGDFQAVCEGGSYSKDGRFCRSRGDDWIAVGGFGTWSRSASRPGSRRTARGTMPSTSRTSGRASV